MVRNHKVSVQTMLTIMKEVLETFWQLKQQSVVNFFVLSTQTRRHFDFPAPSAFRGGYSTHYNIDKATAFENILWCDFRTGSFQGMCLHWLPETCVISVRPIYWHETIDVIESLKMYCSYYDAIYLFHLGRVIEKFNH